MSTLPLSRYLLLLSRKLQCLLFYVDMRILINKALKHVYML